MNMSIKMSVCTSSKVAAWCPLNSPGKLRHNTCCVAWCPREVPRILFDLVGMLMDNCYCIFLLENPQQIMIAINSMCFHNWLSVGNNMENKITWNPARITFLIGPLPSLQLVDCLQCSKCKTKTFPN